jgi:hypothetical protein
MMKNNSFVCLIFFFGLIIFSCSKDNTKTEELKFTEQNSASIEALGATQVRGVGFFDQADDCNSANQGATYAVKMTGDLEGCLLIFIDDYECSPSGTYREVGREKFVGTYKGESGSFWTTYKFEAKYEGCAADGSYLGAEILGRCQHPIVEGSGEGVFEGVRGRLDMKDDIEAGNYPYRGHFNL